MQKKQKKETFTKQEVTVAIEQLIKVREGQIFRMELERREDGENPNRLFAIDLLIANYQSNILTLLELQHQLRLCDCPDEAYVVVGTTTHAC